MISDSLGHSLRGSRHRRMYARPPDTYFDAECTQALCYDNAKVAVIVTHSRT